ncbi:hypothetical protein [Kitasatospora sp. NPDC018619]|uniref:hypothetical protein n=1 Tax=unclassified Kitasatospora TaxID=2633591 RepID=UPI0037BDD7B5
MTTATALPAAAVPRPAAGPPAQPAAGPAVQPVVRPARPEERDALARVLAAAFAEDALMLWAFPDPAHRARVLPAFFRLQAEQSLAHGGALLALPGAGEDTGTPPASGQPLGALLFLPPGRWEDPGDGDGAAAGALAEALGSDGHGAGARRLAAIARLQHRRHPRHRTHHYLSFVGVHPGARRTRAGRALLRAFLAEVDTAGQAAYAEASSPAGAGLLAAHGFTPFGESLALPGGGPRLAPVWRGPR